MIIQNDKTIINSEDEEIAKAVKGYLVIDELLIQKINSLNPNFELVIENGELIDVIEIPAPPTLPQPPTPEEQIQQLRLEQAQANAELFEMMLMLTGGGV